MKLKSFIFILASSLSAESLNAVRTFQALRTYEYPNEEYSAVFSPSLIKDQDAINEEMEKGSINQEDINFCFNFPKVEPIINAIKVRYRPGQISPCITLSQDCPLPKENLILEQFIELSWYQKLKGFGNLPSDFGQSVYSILIPKEGYEYKVGQFEIDLLDPHSYLNHVRKIRHQGIKKTCLKNPELMDVLDVIFNGNNKEVSKTLTQDAVTEAAKLLQAVFSGSVTRHKNPEDGTFLTVNTPLGKLDLPTTRGLREKPYRSHIRTLLKDYLTQGGINLSPDKRYLVVEPTNK